MPVPRDYRAEYRARVERAKSKGFEAGYSEQRRAQRAGLGDDVDKWRAKAEQMRANADVMRRQIHDLGSNKTLLTTTAHGKGFGVIGGRLQGAGTGVVHIKLRDGSTRTVLRGLNTACPTRAPPAGCRSTRPWPSTRPRPVPSRASATS